MCHAKALFSEIKVHRGLKRYPFLLWCYLSDTCIDSVRDIKISAGVSGSLKFLKTEFAYSFHIAPLSPKGICLQF